MILILLAFVIIQSFWILVLFRWNNGLQDDIIALKQYVKHGPKGKDKLTEAVYINQASINSIKWWFGSNDDEFFNHIAETERKAKENFSKPIKK